jgi:hypothetical protein
MRKPELRAFIVFGLCAGAPAPSADPAEAEAAEAEATESAAAPLVGGFDAERSAWLRRWGVVDVADCSKGAAARCALGATQQHPIV